MKPSVSELLITDNRTLRDVLNTIDANAQGMVFIVDDAGRLIGSITDGDVRRGLLRGLTLASNVLEVVNRNCVALSVDASAEQIAATLNHDIRQIPLVDDDRVVVDYAAADRVRRLPVMEPYLMGNELAYVTDCLKSKWISSQGKYVHQFERLFEHILGIPEGSAVAVSNGTVALHLALLTLDIGPGDEVIVPDLTFAASVNTVLHAGATPVLVDVDPTTWCLDLDLVEAAITPKTRAVMPVHLYGQPVEMARLRALAEAHDLRIIEDAAEALGSRTAGRHVGTIGDASAFSFFGNKTVTTGEGGMVVFRDPAHVAHARLLRDHGMSKSKRYWHEAVGFNYRMTNVQAAIGVAQLEQFDTILKRKQGLAAHYTRRLAGVPGIELPPGARAPIGNDVNVFWLYTIRIDETRFGSRDNLIRRLYSQGIETRPVFYPMTAMPIYERFRPSGGTTIAHELSRNGLSLPSSTGLEPPDVDRVCDVLISELQFGQMLNLNEADDRSAAVSAEANAARS